MHFYNFVSVKHPETKSIIDTRLLKKHFQAFQQSVRKSLLKFTKAAPRSMIELTKESQPLQTGCQQC